MQRVLTGWTFSRALYAIIGVLIVIQALMAGQYLGIFLGGYFASMGILGFGCAAGNCYVSPSTEKPQSTKEKELVNDIHFEEINPKR